jgi:oligoendopeptidase F
VSKYLADIESVSQAHLAFWNVQAENSSATAREEASARIKTTIQTREISRQRLLQAIVKSTNPKDMDASELIYLAQWMHRRDMKDPEWTAAAGKAGELLVKISDVLDARSGQPWAEPEAETGGGNAGGRE